jgi:peptidyl-prolyl cis-trans isomerase SurA
MQQEVWNKAQNDSVALQALYEKNKDQYTWKQSADAVIFFCSDEAAAKELHNQMKKDPGSWRKAVEAVSERVVADSARYEWSQIPGIEGKTPVDGVITPLSVNPTDKTASFSLIGKVYEQPSPRSFNEAKGLVMNDYQMTLEQEWVKALKKKYPVVVDQKVLAQILK